VILFSEPFVAKEVRERIVGGRVRGRKIFSPKVLFTAPLKRWEKEEYKNILEVNSTFYPKKVRARIAAIISTTERITTNSGRIFIPWVSSSKKRSRPALAAGIGARFARLFPLRLSLIYQGDL